MSQLLSVPVFSDVICPWCFVGKRRLERALDQCGLAGTAAIRWLPFELNPDMPAGGMERAAALDRDMTALGLKEGIRFAFDRMEQTPNTRAAHCLIAHASRKGRGTDVVEALFTAYFEEARDIGREDVLAEIGVQAGLGDAAIRAALSDDHLRASVVDIEQEAGRLGIGGVPFFILNEKWSVSGAQPAEVWLDVLQQTHDTPAKVHTS